MGREFWWVSECGEKSQYVRNILADPKVRVRIKGCWHTGTAHLLPDDEARAGACGRVGRRGGKVNHPTPAGN